MTNFDKVIPPGSEGKIFAKLDTSHSEGAVQKFIDIKSNDPSTPLMKISIKAVIKSLVNVNPEYLRFDVLKGVLEEADVILTPQPSVKLLKPVIDSPLITAQLVPQKGGKQKLTVIMKQSDIIGTHAIEIKIPVQGPIKEITVPVVIEIHGPLQVSPSVVSFQVNSFPETVSPTAAGVLRDEPNAKSGVAQKVVPGDQLQVVGQTEGWYHVYPEPKESKQNDPSIPQGEMGWIPITATKAVKPPEFPEPQRVQIHSSAGKPFKILNLRSTLPAVKVENKANPQASSTFDFTVSLQKVQGTKKQQHFQGEIVVQTDNKDQPQIKIPLYVIFT